MNTVIIETKDIVKRFGEVTALDHVSFQIRRGEIQGLTGGWFQNPEDQ